MSFQSHSQAGQDRFVHALIGDRGTFLDIGASHPTELSNTCGLEQVGWAGWCVEIEPELCELLRRQRTAKVIQGDATKVDWSRELFPGTIDYLSLDIDEATLAVLRNLPLDRVKFRVITIEHDKYRFGELPQMGMRKILSEAGYVLVRPDVANAATPDMPFEDWWVCPELAEKANNLP